jgi:hypothetical protein
MDLEFRNLNIDAQRAVPVVGRGLFDRAEDEHGRVVHQHVDAAPFLDYGLDEALN